MDQRMIIEMGMGNDLHGMDYQKAAARAIEDAFRHSTLPIFGTLEIPTDAMRVQVTVGVQEPDKLDTDALAKLLPRSCHGYSGQGWSERASCRNWRYGGDCHRRC